MAAEKSTIATAQKPFFVGIDVGGTNIKFGLVDDNGQTLAYHTIRTEQDKGAEDACSRMGQVVRKLVEEAGVKMSDVARAGLATPGPMDIAAGMLLRPGNLPDWWDFPIRDRASHHTGLPVAFANDANAAAYGEFWCGAGAQYHSLVLLTLGTGIGGGIIVGDTLIEGEHSCGSECGHILVNPADDAPIDSLGKRGSLESYANASALVDRALEALGSSTVTSLAKRRATGEEITPRVIAEEAERGDEVARQCIMETGYWLAIGIVSFIHTIDPDAVLLGGAMTFGGNERPVGREFLQTIRDVVRPRLLEPLRETVRIEFASLGGDAGYIGAAGLARLEHRKKR
ncbi:MAG: ROK family protein [Planctomycetes bacterium]|nr:ROK family protein [Planctomycetota bacterium]